MYNMKIIFYNNHLVIHAVSISSISVLDIATKYKINHTVISSVCVGFRKIVTVQHSLTYTPEGTTNIYIYIFVRKHCQMYKHIIHTYLCSRLLKLKLL